MADNFFKVTIFSCYFAIPANPNYLRGVVTAIKYIDVISIIIVQLCFIVMISSYSFSQSSSTTRTWLDELRCLGNETKLINCPANTIGVEDCTHTQDVALFCISGKLNR